MPRGEGYLRKRGKVWYFEFMYKGRRYYEKIGNVSKTVAREIANEIRSQIIKGEYIPKERKLSFTAAVKASISWYETKSPARESSKKEHRRQVQVLESFSRKYDLGSISSAVIESYKRKRLEEGIKKTTLNRELTVLKSIFKRAQELGLWDGQIPKIDKVKGDEKEIVRFLSREEAERLINACPEWFRPVVVFALNTGLRAGEIFSLRWEDIDLERRLIIIKSRATKTKKERLIPVNSTVYSLLMELEKNRKEHGFVFTNRSGLPYKYEDKTYLKVFKTACKKAGIENFRFHDLRHTFASWVAMNSRDIYAVKQLLGHSSLTSTKRYAHLTDDYLKEILESVSNFGSSSAKDLG